MAVAVRRAPSGPRTTPRPPKLRGATSKERVYSAHGLGNHRYDAWELNNATIDTTPPAEGAPPPPIGSSRSGLAGAPRAQPYEGRKSLSGATPTERVFSAHGLSNHRYDDWDNSTIDNDHPISLAASRASGLTGVSSTASARGRKKLVGDTPTDRVYSARLGLHPTGDIEQYALSPIPDSDEPPPLPLARSASLSSASFKPRKKLVGATPVDRVYSAHGLNPHTPAADDQRDFEQAAKEAAKATAAARTRSRRSVVTSGDKPASSAVPLSAMPRGASLDQPPPRVPPALARVRSAAESTNASLASPPTRKPIPLKPEPLPVDVLTDETGAFSLGSSLRSVLFGKRLSPTKTDVTDVTNEAAPAPPPPPTAADLVERLTTNVPKPKPDAPEYASNYSKDTPPTKFLGTLRVALGLHALAARASTSIKDGQKDMYELDEDIDAALRCARVATRTLVVGAPTLTNPRDRCVPCAPALSSTGATVTTTARWAAASLCPRSTASTSKLPKAASSWAPFTAT